MAVRQMTMKANRNHLGAINFIATEEPRRAKRVAQQAEAMAEVPARQPAEMAGAGEVQARRATFATLSKGTCGGCRQTHRKAPI